MLLVALSTSMYEALSHLKYPPPRKSYLQSTSPSSRWKGELISSSQARALGGGNVKANDTVESSLKTALITPGSIFAYK